MTHLTELETHRRMITAQIKREIAIAVKEIREEFLSKLSSLDSRLQEQENAINTISHRLMDLSLHESKLINETQTMKKRNDLMFDRLEKMKHLVESIHPGLKGYEF